MSMKKTAAALLLAMTGACLTAAPYALVNKITDIRKADWSKAVSITGFTKVQTLDYAKEQTTLRLLHDGKYLYGKADMVQKNIASIFGSRIRDDKMMWRSNSIEIFFHSKKGLHHVVFNTEGTIWDMIGQDPSWNNVSVLKHTKGKGSWSVIFRIPIADLGFDYKGRTAFNIVRNNYDQQEFSSWSPLEKFNWHQTEKYGSIALAKSGTPLYGVTFQNLPEACPDRYLKYSVNSAAPTTMLTEFRIGKKWCHRRTRIKTGHQNVMESVLNAGKQHLKTSIFAGRLRLCVMEYFPKGDFLDVYGSNFYTISSVKDMPTIINWRSAHSFEAKNSGGSRVKKNYEILFDVPKGITVLDAVPAGPSPRGKGRKIFSSKRDTAFNAANWIHNKFYAALPDGSKGEIYFRVKWEKYLQKEQKFDFEVCSFKPTPAPKKLLVYFYNHYDVSLKGMNQLRKYGINTNMYRGNNAAAVRALKKAGFYVIRGGYFFPGGGLAFTQWPKIDPTARAMDVHGKVITGFQGSPQISPSYRGRHFINAIAKERKFAIEAGISHFAFDMEQYIMPNAAIACFRPETIARFKTWFAKNYPKMKYISPKVFELNPKKYPEYHHIWIDFKDYIFADFFAEFKRRMDLPASAQSVPWKSPGNISMSEWSCAIPENQEAINRQMRGPKFLETVGWFECSSYTSADRTIRQILRQRQLAKKRYPKLKINFIFCPSPERLDLNRQDKKNYYYDPAEPLKDELKYKIFDALTVGVKGISIWSYPRMTTRAWKSLTDAIRAAVKVEDVLLEGKFMEDLSCDQPLGLLPEVKLYNKKVILKNQPKVLVKGVRKGKEAVISVSEYRDLKPVTVTVTCPVRSKAVVKDLETDEKVAEIIPGKNTFKVKLDSRRCRLLHIVEK